LSGYDLSIEDLKAFRQWGSRTPGHPERGVTPGVEVNTGPLGQGFANAVGMALAERMLAARYNRPGHEVVNHRTWVFAGDGDMMEGVSGEAASLAGQLGLGKLTVFNDDNHISIEGSTNLAFCEHVAGRFKAYGWHLTRVDDPNDLEAIDRAVDAAISDAERPSLIMVRSHIGYGSPVQDNAKAHGSPLGPENVAATRQALGWPYAPFDIPEPVYAHWRSAVNERARQRQAWLTSWQRYRAAEPELASEFERVMAGRLPEGWRDALPTFDAGSRVATPKASGVVLNALAPAIPELIGGAADVAPSTDTYLRGAGDISTRDWSARNFHFGVREHAMGSLLNGIAAHCGLRVFGATFFAFSDYMRPPIRMAAIMRLPVVFVFTHDSIGLGEDGPTHQPI
jgi:transketolase